MKSKTIVAIVLIILCLIVLLQNTQIVTLRFFFWEVSISRIFLLPCLILLGFIMGYVTAKRGYKSRQKSKVIGNEEKIVDESEYRSES